MGSLSQKFSARNVPKEWHDKDQHLRFLSDAVNDAIKGKLSNTGSFTMTANAAATTVDDRRVSGDSVILLIAKTANAAAEMTSLYITTTKNQFTVTHSNDADTDKTFDYIVVG